jgi:hypothetical protein
MSSIYAQSYGVPTGPFRDLEEKRINGDEYAQRVRREVRERIKEAPVPPARKPEPQPEKPAG